MTLLFVLLACIPGAWSLWTGRRVARQLDDPALPELLMARAQRNLTVNATVLALVFVLGGTRGVWAIPLLALADLAGGYPLRRALLGEDAGLGRYVFAGVKSTLGGWGFWFLLILTPVLVMSAGTAWLPVSLALFLLLLLWDYRYLELWLRLHDAVPISDPALQPRIQTIVERAAIAAPDLYRIGAPGLRLVTAFALPSLRRPSIAFGNATLDLLEPDEVAAIYAHELSHIEQFSPRLLRQYQAVTRLLILFAVGAPLLMQFLLPAQTSWLALSWPVIVFLTLLLRARKSQQRETESDLRAAALCGDAETVARALIKLHVHAFIPRRWAVDFERDASHPSLARRIQALRGETGTVAATMDPTVLATGRAGTVLVFDNARGWWFDGVPDDTTRTLEAFRANASSMRSVAWNELVELRVTVGGAERALRAVHRNGDSWSVPLENSQVADVQRALDTVDVRLRKELGRRKVPSGPIVAGALFLTCLLTGQIGVLIIPILLAALRPSTASLAALGAMATASAVLAFALGQNTGPQLALIALAAIGTLALVICWRQVQHERKRDGVRLTMIVLGSLGAMLIALIALAARSTSGIQTVLPTIMPALVLDLIGLATALMISESRFVKRAGIAAATVALLVATPVIINAGEIDRGSALTRVALQATEVRRIELPGYVSGLRLSPGGARFLVQQVERTRWNPLLGAYHVRHILSSANGSRRMIDAVQVEFLDDEHLLALVAVDSTLALRLEHADSPATVWTATLPSMYGSRLAVSPDDRSWTVIGSFDESDSVVVASGTAASPEIRTRWFQSRVVDQPMNYLPFDNGERLIVPVFRTDVGSGGMVWPLMMLFGYTPAVEFWELSADQQRVIGEIPGFPQCTQPVRNQAICIVQDRRSTRLFELTPSGEVRSVGQLDAYALVNNQVSSPRMTVVSGETVTDVDIANRRMNTVQLPAGANAAFEASSAAGILAVLQRAENTTRVLFFRTEQRSR